MAKTRRKKINRSPAHPFGGRNARPKVYVINKGDQITTIGVRGRTKVKRVINEDGKRVTSVRIVEDAVQTPAKAVGDRKPTAIFVGRQYTGVARSKPYPYRSVKRGGAPLAPVGLMARAGKAVKRVLVRDAAE